MKNGIHTEHKSPGELLAEAMKQGKSLDDVREEFNKSTVNYFADRGVQCTINQGGVKCEQCGGSGDYASFGDCPHCGGSGKHS